jgi:ClpX C4-type zinc finger
MEYGVSDSRTNDIFRILAPEWERAIVEKRYHDVIVNGLLGYLLIHEQKSEPFEKVALGYVLKAISDLLSEYKGQRVTRAEAACSFCGRTEPEVRLGAGPGVFICDSCVATFAEIFADKDST